MRLLACQRDCSLLDCSTKVNMTKRMLVNVKMKILRPISEMHSVAMEFCGGTICGEEEPVKVKEEGQFLTAIFSIPRQRQEDVVDEIAKAFNRFVPDSQLSSINFDDYHGTSRPPRKKKVTTDEEEDWP